MQTFTVIAHRGASGYLPEHTLEAAALAHEMGADYIELDAVLTRDGVLIVLHDLFLDAVTDVAARFPGRQRIDGRHYAIDFTWEEIGTLSVHARRDAEGGTASSSQFPSQGKTFRIASLAGMIESIQELNRATGREAGFYIEPKSPAFHAGAGRDVIAAVVELLAEHGLGARDDKVFLQSFDLAALRHARRGLKTGLKRVQLIGENEWRESATDFNRLRTPEGLAEVAAIADGIGAWLPQVITVDTDGAIRSTGLIETAHAKGLFVHAYTLRADRLPEGIADLETAVRILIDAGLDGVFTDHPDQVVKLRH